MYIMDIMDKVTYFSVSWRFTFMVISIIGSSVLLLLLLSSIQSIHLTNNIQYDNCQLSRVSRVSALICYSSSDTATRQLCDTGRYIGTQTVVDKLRKNLPLAPPRSQTTQHTFLTICRPSTYPAVSL